MYNAQQKARFLMELFSTDSYSAATQENAENCLARMEPFEIAAGADICTMSEEQLRDIMDKVAQKGYASRQYFLRILHMYGKWCMDTGVPGATDGLLRLDINSAGIGRVRRTMVSGPKHLQRCLDEIFSPESEETIDNVYRTFFWLAFAGVPADGVTELRTSDFDSTMALHFRDRVIRFPAEAMNALCNTLRLRSFRYVHAKYIGVRRERVQSKQFMRGIKSDADKRVLTNTVHTRVLKAFKDGKTDFHFTFRDIRMSGMFYRIFEIERSDLKQYASGATDRLVRSAMEECFMSRSDNTQAVNETIEDYRRWKEAFRIEDK